MSRLFMTLVRWCVSLAITGLTGGLSLALAQGVPAKSARRCEQDQTVALLSPDGKLRVEFSPRSAGARNGAPFYSVWRRGKRLIEPSGLGLDLAETGPLRANLCLRTVSRNSHDETYRVSVGKSSAARDHYREAVISLEEGLEEQPEPRRRIELVFRAYNDGIAFRYRIPRQPALARFTIAEEHSQFSLPPDSRAYALPLDSFTTSYEKYYRVIPLKEIAAESLIGLPLLAQHPGGTWIAVTEAGLTDYAGMYLSKSSQLPGVLVSRLSPWPGQPEVKVKASAPHASPWRVLLIGDRPATLIESNLVLNLNEACAIADTSWIKPGKTAFPWWNDYVVKDADFAGGLNTRTMKYYIDFCAEYGIEYHSLDGFQNRAWYGGPIRPVGKTDITTAVPEIDLPEVLRYAREKGVRIRLWMHWKALRPQIDEAFPLYEQWGIEGVMVDFMDRDDQEMVNFYHEMVEKAARHHLTVTLHGAYKPTGLERTYPNLLTSEAVLNLEYNKFNRSQGSTPEHELLVPFIRMLAGPLDYHQGGFRHVAEKQFKPRNSGPLIMGTRSRQLAMYVVYENHLPMVADYPAAYRGETGAEFLKQVPANWDETRVLAAAVGDYLTIARRRGKEWYVGSMTDSSPREIHLPLNFLGPGKFIADIYSDLLETDAEGSLSKAAHQQFLVTAKDTIAVKMGSAGGHVIRLTPARAETSLPGYRAN